MGSVDRWAGGVFAPGHLGELTRIVPFEMVDEVLAETRSAQRRVRRLPSRVVVYLLLAAGLFEGQGLGQVWARLVSGLEGPGWVPSSSVLAQARRRVGVAPLRALFDLLAGPPAGAVRWRGLLVCAMDGTTMSVPDSPANLAAYGHQSGSHGGSGYPLVRLVAVVACGTRTVLGAGFGRFATGETAYAPELFGCLKAGMLLLADRNFAVKALVAAIAGPQGTGADLLIRCKSNRPLPRLETLADRSWRSVLGGVPIRVIDAQITLTLSGGGHRTGHYRLITTLLDPRLHPAAEIVRLYHQRWEIETTYLELKSTMLGGRVLRSRTPQGADQEIYALLAVYQALRLAMADATAGGGLPADRASFTVALLAARDQVVHAAGVIAGTVIDLVGQIGRAVLDNPLPARRDRSCPRIVKRAISKHRAKGQVDRTNHRATLTIDILHPPELTPTPSP
ncbi:IS4 family transposase [Actinomadura rugatobispora]|uniref:IS4 family transposase n=1 Tax=Actinomadura rugatobispora TaxID=1994 RepID=A0ABW1AK26_9ACTN|nr:IS4 family transposase [Actinomadura rugatobispora]BFE32465.1 IS4 family transposase [Actinomadura rugatobispora]BFE34770.1 IS4 family transposase [Actinomadura rugatobispora]BFE35981.1 IS4 family transposase [Actinomadura rugatobispora]